MEEEGQIPMEIVEDHEKRIMALEDQQSKMLLEMKTIQSSQYKIENTVLNEGKEQKALLNKLLTYHLDMNKTKISNRHQLMLTFFGGGGTLYFIFELVVKPLIEKGGP